MLRSACGVDVHRDSFTATVLTAKGCETRRFDKDLDGVEAFKGWLRAARCRAVVMESTGVYWIPLYAGLEDEFDVKLANAQKTRSLLGKKTDKVDSKRLANLLRAGLIEACYVPERKVRVLRELTRLRTKLVQNRTDYRNRVHKVLQRCNIRLGSRLSDVFGKAGREVLDGLMAGRSLDEVVTQTRSRLLQERRAELEEVVRAGLDEEDIFLLQRCLRMIERLDEELKEVDARIATLLTGREKDAERISRVPGVGKVAAPAVLAEIGDPKRFPGGKQVASWAGLCPTVYQTGEKNLTGHIKQGSKWLRRIMVQVAHSAARARDSKLGLFYLRIAARRGRKKAVVALARKLLTVIHHLLLTGEEYLEAGLSKKTRPRRVGGVVGMRLEEMARALEAAGYLVRPAV